MHNIDCTMHNCDYTMHDGDCTMHRCDCTMHGCECTMHDCDCTMQYGLGIPLHAQFGFVCHSHGLEEVPVVHQPAPGHHVDVG